MQQAKTIIIIFMHIRTFWWREKILYVGIEEKRNREIESQAIDANVNKGKHIYLRIWKCFWRWRSIQEKKTTAWQIRMLVKKST